MSPTPLVAEHRDGTNDHRGKAEQDMDAHNDKEDRISGWNRDTENDRRVFLCHSEDWLLSWPLTVSLRCGHSVAIQVFPRRVGAWSANRVGSRVLGRR